MSDNNNFMRTEQSENSTELQVKYSLMLNKLNQVITSIFGIVNKHGSSFSFSKNKHFLAKVDLDNNVSLLKEICQDIDNVDYSDDPSIEMNILPIISQANIGRFKNFSSQLDDSNPKWYVEFNEDEALLDFITIWRKKELTLREDAEMAWMNNSNYQHKDLLIAYAKWQCFSPIADYLNQAMTHKVIACYSGDCELNVKEDQYTNNIINNAVLNCIDIFPVSSSLDKDIVRGLLSATEQSLSSDLESNIVYLDGSQINRLDEIDPPLTLQNFTIMTNAMTKDCNLTLSNKEYQTLNLTNIDCLLNWEIY